MKLTKRQLKQIIKEEIANILLQEQGKPVPRKPAPGEKS